MRISDWSSDVCSSDLTGPSCICRIGDRHRPRCVACSQSVDIVSRNRTEKPGCGLLKTGHIEHHRGSCPLHQCRRSGCGVDRSRSEEHTSELQSLMRISYAVFCLKKKIKHTKYRGLTYTHT